jgi:hypothetical protein
MAILVLAETLTIFFAWKTADAPDGFSDTNYILLTLGLQIQAWIVGVPILAVLGSSSADATYLGRVFLVWVFAVSSVAIVVWPRIILAIRLRRNPALRQKSRVRISGLIQKPDNNGLLPGGNDREHPPPSSKKELIASALQRVSERASAALDAQGEEELKVSSQTSLTGSMTSGDMVAQSLDSSPSSSKPSGKALADILEERKDEIASTVNDVEMPLATHQTDSSN